MYAPHSQCVAPALMPQPDPAEADAALRCLEAEWSMRMEAPLSQLAGFEASLSRAIDDVADSLGIDLRRE